MLYSSFPGSEGSGALYGSSALQDVLLLPPARYEAGKAAEAPPCGHHVPIYTEDRGCVPPFSSERFHQHLFSTKASSTTPRSLQIWLPLILQPSNRRLLRAV